MDSDRGREGITVFPADFKGSLFVLGRRRGHDPMITGVGRLRCRSRLQVAVFVYGSVL